MPKTKPRKPAAPKTKTRAASAPVATGETRPKKRAAKVLLTVAALLYLLFASGYNLLVPVNSDEQQASLASGAAHFPTNPDEAAHIANILVYRSGHLPVFREGNPDFEAHQPPLYYALMAPFVQQNGGATDLMGVRHAGIFIGLLILLATFGCVRTLFPERPLIAAATAAFVGLLPMNVSLCASVSNDGLTNLLVIVTAWLLVGCARAAERNTGNLYGWAGSIGVGIGLGLLTKTSTLVLLPTAWIVFWQLARQKTLTNNLALRLGIIATAVGLVIAAPWWTRNTLLYGDPLAQHLFMTAFRNTALTSTMVQFWSLPVYLSHFMNWTFDSFWGVFDSMHKDGFLPAWVYAAAALVSVLSLLGLLRWAKETPLSPAQNSILFGFTGLIVFTVAAFIRFNMVFFQAQGRYLYTALLPLSLLFVLGLLRNKKFDVFVSVCLILALSALNIASLVLLRETFWPQGWTG